MHSLRKNPSSTVNNHSNTSSQKGNDNSPEPKLKAMGDCDQNVRISTRKKLKETQASPERQPNDLRNKINEQKKYFTKSLKLQKKKFWS